MPGNAKPVTSKEVAIDLGYTVQDVVKMVRACNTLARVMAENNGKSDGMQINCYDNKGNWIARCEEVNGVATVYTRMKTNA